MCGRFTLTTTDNLLQEIGDADLVVEETPFLPGMEPQFNIAPTQSVAVLSFDKIETSRLSQMRWGLIQHWASDDYLQKPLFNARSETIREKPSFRESFRQRRCLIFADGYYEWKVEGKDRQPYFFHLPDRRLFAFAGLWDQWRSPTDETIQSCTIVTTSASARFEIIHPRQPVILPPEEWKTWINPEFDDLKVLDSMMSHNAAEKLEHYAVSSYVNKTAHDDERCLEPASIQGSLFD